MPHRSARRLFAAFSVAFSAALLALGCAFVASAAAAQEAGGEKITVFAAASMKEALEDAAKGFQAEGGCPASLAFAGSSTLARQIQQGAPADLFVSANEAWMDALAADGLIDPATRFDLARNTLVLIAPVEGAGPAEAETPEVSAQYNLAARLEDGKLAMALIDAVPAGIYGKAALQSLGLWDGVAPHVAQADNVRAALAFVAASEAPFGVVYATDAAAESAVRIVAVFPEGSHPPILYPAAAIAERDSACASAFLAFLRGPAARAILTARGFRPVAE